MASRPTSTPLFSTPIRHLVGVAGALIGGWIGLFGGEALAYAIAEWTDRDIAELKDMLIWSTFGGGLIGLLLGVFVVLVCMRSSSEARRLSLVSVAAAMALVGGLMLATFDWPKSSGTPNVQYEIRLPAGTPQPRRDKVDVVLWAEKSGKGCYVSDLRRENDQPVIAGSFLVTSKSDNQTLALRLNRETEGHWKMPIRADAQLDQTFGPWQRIEFVPTPRENMPALPSGEYEVRYRVKKYL
jgi:hypothetical protein